MVFLQFGKGSTDEKILIFYKSVHAKIFFKIFSMSEGITIEDKWDVLQNLLL